MYVLRVVWDVGVSYALAHQDLEVFIYLLVVAGLQGLVVNCECILDSSSVEFDLLLHHALPLQQFLQGFDLFTEVKKCETALRPVLQLVDYLRVSFNDQFVLLAH